jgi:lipopolysaccharide biosynthesis protein
MKRIGVFAHYDGQDEVKAYVVILLRALREVCPELVFVSTARLPATELAKVAPFCSRAFVRENLGYDFGMWQEGLSSEDLESADEVVLTNSSVFGPLYPLAPIFERMARHECDFWGMTDSFEVRWHLQSYFLVFKRQALGSPAFSQFIGSVLPYRDKAQVIRSYEIGLTQFLREHGLKPGAFVPMASWVTSPRQRSRLCAKRRNATLYFPLQLLAAGMPFVKVQLLRDNPAGVPLQPVLRAMQQSGYDTALVRFDRARVGGSLADALRERLAGRRIESERDEP